MSEGATEFIRKASDHKSKIAVGGVSVATLFAVWQFGLHPQMEWNRSQSQQIREQGERITKLEAKMDVLLAQQSRKFE